MNDQQARVVAVTGWYVQPSGRVIEVLAYPSADMRGNRKRYSVWHKSASGNLGNYISDFAVGDAFHLDKRAAYVEAKRVADFAMADMQREIAQYERRVRELRDQLTVVMVNGATAASRLEFLDKLAAIEAGEAGEAGEVKGVLHASDE